MKHVEFVQVSARTGFIKDVYEETRDIIENMAIRGYSYQGYVPLEIHGYGALRKIDLVFEKEVFEE